MAARNVPPAPQRAPPPPETRARPTPCSSARLAPRLASGWGGAGDPADKHTPLRGWRLQPARASRGRGASGQPRPPEGPALLRLPGSAFRPAQLPGAPAAQARRAELAGRHGYSRRGRGGPPTPHRPPHPPAEPPSRVRTQDRDPGSPGREGARFRPAGRARVARRSSSAACREAAAPPEETATCGGAGLLRPRSAGSRAALLPAAPSLPAGRLAPDTRARSARGRRLRRSPPPPAAEPVAPACCPSACRPPTNR